MKKTIQALTISAALVATLWPASGMAHLVRRADPDDAPGTLDIVKTSYDHANGNTILSFATASPWSKADVYAKECAESASASFKLDTKSDGDNDYFIRIYVDEETNAFAADLYDYEFGTYLELGDFGTITKTRRSLSIKFPNNAIEAYGKAPRWKAFSASFDDDDPCDDNLPRTYDYAPNSGWFRHKR